MDRIEPMLVPIFKGDLRCCDSQRGIAFLTVHVCCGESSRTTSGEVARASEGRAVGVTVWLLKVKRLHCRDNGCLQTSAELLGTLNRVLPELYRPREGLWLCAKESNVVIPGEAGSNGSDDTQQMILPQ